MAVIKHVEITLDQPRKLLFDWNAVADLEEGAGINLMRLLSEERAGFSTIRALVWAGLKHEDPRLTKQRAGVLLHEYVENGGSMDELFKAVLEALNKGLPGANGGAKPGKEPAGAATAA